ncbi:hypothetical protein [Weissella confusa]|uniref:hypothetical protein n=1 Tax=Weissella confusa TaxID=1583 RepID=UPI00107F2ECE|nr:hypothetical protein [Weissella confusa]TGE72355.1 hypothetical protein C6P10_10700 [Weissella confusa]
MYKATIEMVDKFTRGSTYLIDSNIVKLDKHLEISSDSIKELRNELSTRLGVSLEVLKNNTFGSLYHEGAYSTEGNSKVISIIVTDANGNYVKLFED